MIENVFCFLYSNAIVKRANYSDVIRIVINFIIVHIRNSRSKNNVTDININLIIIVYKSLYKLSCLLCIVDLPNNYIC